MRYKDNGDGTVTDTKTGLMWQKDPSPERMEWGQAKQYIKGLKENGFAGYSDWRFPSRDELLSLMDNEDNRKNFLYLNPIFGNQRCYWAGDEVGEHRRGHKALYVDYYYGGVYKFPEKYANHSVRAVRGAGSLE